MPVLRCLPRRKHPFYLNGRLIFLVMAQTWFAFCFAARNTMLERFVFRWSRNTSSNSVCPLLRRDTQFDPFVVQHLPKSTRPPRNHRTVYSALICSIQRYRWAYQNDRATHPPPSSDCINYLASADRTLCARALDTHSTATPHLSRVPHIHIGMDNARQLGICRSALRRPHSPSTYFLS